MVRRLALVAAVAVVLAGCSAFPQSGSTTTPAETVTPVSVPTDTPDPGAGLDLPPGVSANGTVDPAALGRAHRVALRDRSFTWQAAYEQRDLDTDSIIDGVDKRMQVGDGGAYWLRTERSESEYQMLYADETGSYTRLVLNNRSADRYLENAIDYRHYLTMPGSLHAYLSTDAASVTPATVGDRTYVRVHLTSPPPTIRGRHPKQTVHNYTATAYVTPEGLVRTLVVSYDYTLRADHIAVSLRIDYDRFGETTVEQPAWASAMERNRTATPAPTATPTSTVAGPTTAMGAGPTTATSPPHANGTTTPATAASREVS